MSKNVSLIWRKDEGFDPAGGVLLADARQCLVIEGLHMHVNAIRIDEASDEGQALTEAGQELLTAAYGLYNQGPFETVEIPGFEGRWVIVAYAHQH